MQLVGKPDHQFLPDRPSELAILFSFSDYLHVPYNGKCLAIL